MWAGAVAAPLRSTSEGIVSTISMSRSVAVSLSSPLAASIITFERIGIVLRRSTTLWTWLSALRKAPRSTLIFMALRTAVPLVEMPQTGNRPKARNPLICLGPEGHGLKQGTISGGGQRKQVFEGKSGTDFRLRYGSRDRPFRVYVRTSILSLFRTPENAGKGAGRTSTFRNRRPSKAS